MVDQKGTIDRTRLIVYDFRGISKGHEFRARSIVVYQKGTNFVTDQSDYISSALLEEYDQSSPSKNVRKELTIAIRTGWE